MRRRQRRQSSNIFHMLTKNQIVELREAFNFMDVNSDTFVDRKDLESFLVSIGSPFSNKEVTEMMDESGDNMTYMLFLTMIGERLSCTDSEKEIFNALKEFDDNGDGTIDEKMLRAWLMEKGDQMAGEDVDLLLKGCVENGRVDCKSLTTKIKYGEIITE
ncbi:Ca2+-binding protein [Encephalitozoon hellem ATCC 50504]|uniref:Ca2+-binding protein calmodulin n=1 Tax=Encephalitozoon hellem TaxID=27973 RepID=A0A9Q9C5E4_ENCHE|nr:Ca2+-binding protein [Encephalitozoon hellem ATCC 50504]AFM98046.1 Ca2+-binding protein [Encephalitozoon hellem ATCC 50504]UTX42852.1 Ca2+-binding protein calmodulin [Encephalitozoon hellem]|eukprot:XP_003887027.1 Ca2+-binding protein [Encephalitozoon hellem ATCC 50504]